MTHDPGTKAALAEYVAREFERRAAPPEVIAARNASNPFCEYVFRTQEGDPITQAPHHRLWQDLTDKYRHVVMWYPIEHGKTTQAKMKLCRLLGRHGDRQYAFVASKAKQARKVVGATKREIESNTRLHKVYPRLKPQRNTLDSSAVEWGTTALRVDECPRGIPDPSLAAYGLDSDILGSRLHGVIIDNGLDKANTRSDGMREWAREVIEDEIIGRVMEGGFIWILDTAWFEDDYMHTFATRPGWESVRLDALQTLDGTPGPLWPEQFPQERLDRRLAELGQTAFDRQYRNMPLSETMGFFKKEFWEQAYGRCRWLENWDNETPRAVDLRTGVDLATRKGESHDLTVFTTVVASGARRQVRHMYADRIEGVAILRKFIDIYRRLHRPINLAGGNARFVVEDNAAQVYIVQMLKDVSILRSLGLTPDEANDIRVVGRTTTAKRRDQELGIPGIASGLETGRYDIAINPETEQLRNEMRVWSPEADHYGDRLMSLWFAVSDLRATKGTFRVDFI